MMDMKDGDVLVCTCDDCNIELTVNRTCSGDDCAHEDSECELVVMCCGEPMKVRSG
jgi:hypothetical protein